METALTKNQIIAVLTKSPHGDLAQYADTGSTAAREDADFFSHLIAWNYEKGSIRDAKVALPVLALTSPALAADVDLKSNALACLAKLDPRNLLRAVRFTMSQAVVGKSAVYRMAESYLRQIESSPKRFEGAALQHRRALRELYAVLHIKPSSYADAAIFKGQPEGRLKVLRELRSMDSAQAAGVIVRERLPFLAVTGAMGKAAAAPEVVQALLEVMSPAEIITNAKRFDKLGVRTNPALRASYDAALTRVSDTSSTAATLKTSKAAEAVGGAGGEKLKGVQERQLQKLSLEGDWLVMVDRSESMTRSFDIARHIAAFLARVAGGEVNLVFFNVTPDLYRVTGMTLEQIAEMTKRITANGGTSPGSALAYAASKALPCDGIVYVGDCNENVSPDISSAFKSYTKVLDKEPPLYVYQVKGDPPTMLGNLERQGIAAQVFDLRGGVDYYALPNLLQTMRTNRFSLVDEIMQTPLLRLGDVLKQAA
jgi:hypothetical protein